MSTAKQAIDEVSNSKDFNPKEIQNWWSWSDNEPVKYDSLEDFFTEEIYQYQDEHVSSAAAAGIASQTAPKYAEIVRSSVPHIWTWTFLNAEAYGPRPPQGSNEGFRMTLKRGPITAIVAVPPDGPIHFEEWPDEIKAEILSSSDWPMLLLGTGHVHFIKDL